VDDNDALRDNIAECLVEEGFDVAEARDGVGALAVLSRGPLPHVVLIDMVMPGMSGTDLVEAIRRDPRLAGLRLVVSTGAPPARGQVDVDAVLRKPFGIAELLATVRRVAGAGSPR
jgi:CheY-like chemotaxis protein